MRLTWVIAAGLYATALPFAYAQAQQAALVADRAERQDASRAYCVD